MACGLDTSRISFQTRPPVSHIGVMPHGSSVPQSKNRLRNSCRIRSMKLNGKSCWKISTGNEYTKRVPA